MAVSVIIQRRVKDKEIGAKLAPYIVQLRSKASVQPGFITGQTFSCIDCDGEYMVISTWDTMEDWQRWMNSDERRMIQKKVDDLLGESSRYRYYEPLVGGIPPKFEDA
ncbi:MAG TPA: antibiotic biosynthesis monooxygenase [Desulfobacteraceae bacterium]|nr:antibiotic biosynthesis monooxygenase [Desulfobacteraceae bacterium]